MKFRLIIVAAAALSFAACKTPYKATDRPIAAKDSTAAATTDTAMKKMPVSTDTTNLSKMDSASMPKTDSARVDSTSKPFPDSIRTSTKTDTIMMQPAPDTAMKKDSAMKKPEFDSTRVSPTDSAKMTPSKEITTQAPAAVEAVFIKQYPNATNVAWSSYDSLANIPIDMRLTGWKKMDAEDHMVKFEFEGATYYAWYDNNGKWIGSASPMEDFTKLPPVVNTAVKNAIKTRYAGYTISQVNREFQTGGKKSYEVELIKDDSKIRMMVNSAGKVTQIFKYAAEKTK